MTNADVTSGSGAVSVKLTETLTEYVILNKDDSGFWSEQDSVEARSSDAAIRKSLNGSALDGEWVAIPKRSWKPVTVTTKQTTTLDLKPAT